MRKPDDLGCGGYWDRGRQRRRARYGDRRSDSGGVNSGPHTSKTGACWWVQLGGRSLIMCTVKPMHESLDGFRDGC